jgi:hypothetical protein
MIKLAVNLPKEDALRWNFALQKFKLFGLSTWMLFLIVLNVKG